MEQNIVIYIGIYKTLSLIAVIIAGAWYASYRLTKVETKIDTTETRMTNLEGRMDKAFAGQSPISLLPKGVKILEESGLKKYIDDNKDKLLKQCESKNPMTNPYDIQVGAFLHFDQINFDAEFEKKLKETAYQEGVNIETVKRVGGIYFRDICLSAAGFKLQDLDKPKTS